MSSTSESNTLEKETASTGHQTHGPQPGATAPSLAFDPLVERLFHGAADAPARSLSTATLRTPVLQRAQRLYGNRASQQIVMRAGVLQRQCACGGVCERCRENFQRKADSAGPVEFDGIPASHGDPLNGAIRKPLESYFGADLADVRVHAGSEAARSAESLDSLAYTSGRDIYFAAGMYSPASMDGQRLLTHEVAHVVQQSSGKAPAIAAKSSHGLTIGAPDDALETEAERAAEEFPLAQSLHLMSEQGQVPSETPGTAVEAVEGSFGGVKLAREGRFPIVQRSPVKGAKAPRPAPDPDSTKATELDHGVAAGKRGVAMVGLVRSTLFPAYRRAVDALDTMAALEWARHVVGSIQVAEQDKSEVQRTIPDNDYHRFLVSTPGHPEESETVIQGKFLELVAAKADLLVSLPALEGELAVKIGPQMFRDQPVLGSYTVPPLGKDPTALLARESGAAVELLAVVRNIQEISGAKPGTSPLLTAAQTEEIVALVEPWKSRPVNFAFLVRALSEDGVWQAVSNVRGQSGKTLQQTNAAVLDQVKETGALADVGELDKETLHALFSFDANTEERSFLGQNGLDPHYPEAMQQRAPIDDASAREVFDKLEAAAPDARGPIIRQIERMGMLGEFCDHLPWKYVEALHDAVIRSDAHAAGLLFPHYRDKGGGKSLHKMEMDEVDEHLSDEHENYINGIPIGKGPDKVGAFGWFFLDFLSNVFTAGFHHEYSDAHLRKP